MAQYNESLERAIVGALRSTIHDHGPITARHIGSAAKRIIGQLASLRGDGLATNAGRSAKLKRLAALRRPRPVRSV